MNPMLCGPRGIGPPGFETGSFLCCKHWSSVFPHHPEAGVQVAGGMDEIRREQA